MIKIYFRIIITTWKSFGSRSLFWVVILLFPVFWGFTRLTLFLDLLIFQKVSKISIKQPVFIIGNPRSGTSFLHHLLTDIGDFAAFETWHLLFPSITVRVLFKPLINLLEKNISSIIPDEIGHGVAINQVEEEEMLFLHQLDTQFVFQLTPLAFDDQEHPELRFYDQQPNSRRHSSAKFFKSCLQRQLYYLKRERVIAQIHFSTHRIKTLLETFPDAKFIYVIRSPYQTIPSHLSLTRNLFDYIWKLKRIPSDKLRRYFERRYLYDVDIYRYFHNLMINHEIPKDQLMILPYDLLCSSLTDAFDKIVSFTEIQPSQKLQQFVAKKAQKQKDYQRKHTVMELEDFGLTKEKIREDLSFVFEEYCFDIDL